MDSNSFLSVLLACTVVCCVSRYRERLTDGRAQFPNRTVIYMQKVIVKFNGLDSFRGF